MDAKTSTKRRCPVAPKSCDCDGWHWSDDQYKEVLAWFKAASDFRHLVQLLRTYAAIHQTQLRAVTRDGDVAELSAMVAMSAGIAETLLGLLDQTPVESLKKREKRLAEKLEREGLCGSRQEDDD